MPAWSSFGASSTAGKGGVLVTVAVGCPSLRGSWRSKVVEPEVKAGSELEVRIGHKSQNQ